MLRGMAEPPDPLPTDPAELVRIIRRLKARNADLHAQVETLKAMIFGAKSERAAVIDPEQGVLDLGDLAVEAAPAANDNVDRTSRKPKQRLRRPANRNVGALPRHLPRVETTIEPESTACPCCAGAMHRIGEDVAEALDVIPAIVRVLRTIRPKYACRCCHGALVQAAAKPRVAAWPPPRWLPTWWWRSSRGICRCTDRLRCSPARASCSTGRPWCSGCAGRRGG